MLITNVDSKMTYMIETITINIMINVFEARKRSAEIAYEDIC